LAGIDVNTAAGITKSIGNAANNYQTLSGLQNPGDNINYAQIGNQANDVVNNTDWTNAAGYP